MSANDTKFEETFQIATSALRINRSHPAISRDNIWKAQFIMINIVVASCTFLLSNSIVSHDIPNGKYTEACKNAIMVIVAVTITIKYCLLLHHQESIMNLIRIVNEDYESAKQLCEEEQEIIIMYSKKGVKVCKLWFISAFITSATFPLKALFLMAYKYVIGEFELIPMFDLTFPSFIDVYKNVPVIFCTYFWMCFMFDCYATSIYIGFDPLIPIFMLHVCGQLEVICRRIMVVFENKDEDAKQKLKEIVSKLQDIYRFVDFLKINFTVMYEYNMKTTTFLLPLTAFQIVESLRRGEINLEFFSFFTAVVLHFYMPCYYSDLLMETGEKLRQTIYLCGWEQHTDVCVRRMVLYMLSRATLPLVIKTVFYPICLDTFAEMCRHSYAIFNIMNAAWV